VDPLAALKLSYAESLPSRLRTLDHAVRAWKRDPRDAARRERARNLAHRLHGTTGCYGLAAVSAVMGTLERALRSDDGKMIDSIEPALGDARARVDEAVAALRRERGFV
jgi:HPt (histidine-containing phosphotransfer) domain-containing protein